jgi:membrane fusion protein (multidrug efflux system)
MHSTLEKDQTVPGTRTGSRNGSPPRERNTSINLPVLKNFDGAENRLNGLAGAPPANPSVVIQPRPLPAAETRNGAVSAPVKAPGTRQTIFRCARLVLAGALVSSAGIYARKCFTTATSERAYINGEITAVRAPIAGQLHFERIEPGKLVRAGSPLFSIENARFGNQEAMSQLNWVKELAERLRTESDEAALRFRQQQEVYPLQEKLYAEKLISRLMLLEEQNKLELARAAMDSRQALAIRAEQRAAEVLKQVELQKTAIIQMPFDGAAWAVRSKTGAEISLHETVVELIDPKHLWVDAFFHERHAQKLAVGATVHVRAIDGGEVCTGTVESVRAGVGRIAFAGETAVAPGGYAPRRIAVRVRLDSDSALSAGEFFGVGRSVVVTLNDHE